MRDYVRECIEKRIDELRQYREKYFKDPDIQGDNLTGNENFLDWIHSPENDELCDLLDFITERYGEKL